MLWINEKLKNNLSHKSFDDIMALRGECFRHQKLRMTEKIKIGNQTYFIKKHLGVSLKEILKNILQLKWPVVTAKNEWQALLHLQKNHIHAAELMAYGKESVKSFVLMQDIHPAISLEEVLHQWQKTKPTRCEKRKLISAVADIARKMHQSGMNHRDFYLCHFLLDLTQPADKPILYLIDLHRAEIHHKVSFRAQVKDLAALYFSSKEIAFSKSDLYYFMQCYHLKPIRNILKEDKLLWKKVVQRAEKLYHDHCK